MLATTISAAIDDPTPPERQRSQIHTVVRPLGNWPPGFKEKAAMSGSKIFTANSEPALLANALGTCSLELGSFPTSAGSTFVALLPLLFLLVLLLKVSLLARLGQLTSSSMIPTSLLVTTSLTSRLRSSFSAWPSTRMPTGPRSDEFGRRVPRPRATGSEASSARSWADSSVI